MMLLASYLVAFAMGACAGPVPVVVEQPQAVCGVALASLPEVEKQARLLGVAPGDLARHLCQDIQSGARLVAANLAGAPSQ